MALIAGLAATAGFPGQAHAYGLIREMVAQHLGVALDAVPCDTCHLSPEGGDDRTQPFYLTLEQHGINAKLPDTFPPAIDSMEAAGTDSDGDAALDIAELKAGTNPNDRASSPNPDQPPPPPPPPPGPGAGGSGGSGGGNPPPTAGSGGRSGSSTRPSSDENEGEETAESFGSTDQGAACSYGNSGGARAEAAAALVAIGLLAGVRRRRRQGS